jgi:hypothetical protein
MLGAELAQLVQEIKLASANMKSASPAHHADRAIDQ